MLDEKKKEEKASQEMPQQIKELDTYLEKQGYESVEIPTFEGKKKKLKVGEWVDVTWEDVETREDSKHNRTYKIYRLRDNNTNELHVFFSETHLDLVFKIVALGESFILGRLPDEEVGQPSPMHKYGIWKKKTN